MKKNRKMIYIGLAGLIGVLAIIIFSRGEKTDSQEVIREIQPVVGNLQRFISTTGNVGPQNRLEIKPPIGGRIEEIFVDEGQKVRRGDILALMSSTERATLLDAAHLKNKEELAYWKNVYKATPLIAPIDGEVIVRAVEPGQTVTATDAVIVLSDRLIVKADVDETDIGRVNVGDKAIVSLDAYPGTEAKATVDHISYESTVVNNVTIYKVDILPEAIPSFFRSGMSANVDIITDRKENVLLVPLKAVVKDNGKAFVLLKNGKDKPMPQEVQLGMDDDENVEVVSGLSPDDTIIISSKKYTLPSEDKENGSNPFFPKFNRKKK